MKLKVNDKASAMQTALATARKEIESKYYNLVDDFEQFLSVYNLKCPDFVFGDLEIINSWKIGDLSNEEVKNQFYKFEVEAAARNKILRPFDKFYNVLDDAKYPEVEEKLRKLIHTLLYTIVPLYTGYLKRMEFLFIHLAHMDAKKPQVIMGYNGDTVIEWAEIPLDQALRRIKALRIDKLPVTEYNTCMIKFTTSQSDLAKYHWLICTTPAMINHVKALYHIKLTRKSQNVGAWLNLLEKQLVG